MHIEELLLPSPSQQHLQTLPGVMDVLRYQLLGVPGGAAPAHGPTLPAGTSAHTDKLLQPLALCLQDLKPQSSMEAKRQGRRLPQPHVQMVFAAGPGETWDSTPIAINAL